jgi:hypothetical protein
MSITGKKYQLDFGMANAVLHIESETQLTFTITQKGGEAVNITETVAIRLTELRPQLYMITWKELSGTTVSQVHDYERGIIYSNWTSPDGEFSHARGTLLPYAG